MQKWFLYAIGSAFFAALTAIFGKLGVNTINSNMATLIRTVIILGIIIVIVCYRQDWQRLSSINSYTWFFLILSGIATGLSWLCYYHALQLGPVSRIAPIDKLSVVFAILLGVIFLGEKLTIASTIGGGLIFLGVIVIVMFE